jgi:hypothetical protein
MAFWVPRRRTMMTRWIAAAACALALALAVPLANQAVADGIPAGPPVYKHKRCIAPASWFSRSGERSTWVCRADQKCCYDRFLRRGSCIAGNARCF